MAVEIDLSPDLKIWPDQEIAELQMRTLKTHESYRYVDAGRLKVCAGLGKSQWDHHARFLSCRAKTLVEYAFNKLFIILSGFTFPYLCVLVAAENQ